MDIPADALPGVPPLKRPVLITALIAVIASQTSPARALEPAERLIDEQRTEQARSRLRSDALPSPAAGPTDAPALARSPADLDEPGEALAAPDIRIHARGLLDAATLEWLRLVFAAQPLGIQRLSLLIRRIDAALIEAGWITSRSRVAALDPVSGVVEIEVVPGRVASISPLGVADRVLPLVPEDVLSQAALEQGVQQINRLRLMQAQVKVLPGSQPGYSVLDLTLHGDERLWSLAFGADNQGSEQTGSARQRIAYRCVHALGLYEDFQLLTLRSADSEALLASLSVPAGWSLWSVTASASKSDSTLAGLRFGSDAQTLQLGWQRVLSLSAQARHALDVSLSHARIARDIGGVDLLTRRSSVLRVSWVHTGRTGYGQYFIEPALSRGLRLFGAVRDTADLAPDHTHYQFSRLTLNAGAALPLSEATELALQYTGQYARNALPGAEQLYLGGMGSIRGYAENLTFGDRGHLLRMELRHALSRFDGALRLLPFVHLDGGSVRQIGGSDITLTSAGVGVRAQAGGWTLDTALSAPLSHPDTLSSGWRLHVSLGYLL